MGETPFVLETLALRNAAAVKIYQFNKDKSHGALATREAGPQSDCAAPSQ